MFVGCRLCVACRVCLQYLPVLQERLECLRNQAQQGIAEDGRAPAVSEQSLQQYAAKVVELKSVLVSAQQVGSGCSAVCCAWCSRRTV